MDMSSLIHTKIINCNIHEYRDIIRYEKLFNGFFMFQDIYQIPKLIVMNLEDRSKISNIKILNLSLIYVIKIVLLQNYLHLFFV